jgi:CopG family transcriptional regulator, nickel-responsive regulator
MSPAKRPQRDKLARFSVSLPESLLDELDAMVKKRGYASRSQAVATLARDGLLEHATRLGTETVAGTISLVYDHTTKGLQAKLSAIQHRYFLMIVTSMHVHLENHNYMEVLLVQGKANELQDLADELTTCRGVRTGKLNLTAVTIPPLL